MRFFQRLFEQLKQIWDAQSRARQVLGVAIALVAAVAIGGVDWWAWQPQYRTLFSGLSPEDAAAVTAKLQAQNVPYRLTAGGTAVQVPADQAQQLKIDLAAEGLPGKADKGYGLFDEGSPLGMTPFMQHVNYGRAHIARPEPSPFVREQKPTTASVFVKLRPGSALSRSTAAGIVALVARSVEGLTPENVTLLDTTGKVLSEAHAADGTAGLSGALEYRERLEKTLAAKAEEMLDAALGKGRAVVRVTADIDLVTRREKRDTVDPESKVVIRSESTTQKSTGGGRPAAVGVAGAGGNLKPQPPAAAPAPPSSDQRETSMEEVVVSKTEQTIEHDKGKVERLTVAAMVDLSPKDQGASALSREEVEEIIKKAVGYKKERGDEVKVSSVKLASAAELTGMDQEWLEMQRWQNYLAIARQAALVLGWLLLRRLRPAPAPAPAPPAEEPERPRLLETLETAAQRDPDAVARVLTVWLQEGQPPRKAAA